MSGLELHPAVNELLNELKYKCIMMFFNCGFSDYGVTFFLEPVTEGFKGRLVQNWSTRNMSHQQRVQYRQVSTC